MAPNLISKLSDAANPGTVPAWVAAVVLVLVVLLVWRALLPQWRALRGRRTTRRHHRRALLAWRQKDREGDPPGR